MPLLSVTLGFTIIAHDINDPLQVGRHGMLRNVPGSRLPRRRHALLTHDSLFANGTTIVKAGQFTKAVRMNGMSTRQVLRRLPRGKHVFATHGAIVLVLVLETLVGVKDRDGNAHATLVAVTKGFDAANATKAALNAMKGLFGL